MLVEGGADLFDVSAVDADGFVELVAGDVELPGSGMDVGGHPGVDLFGINCSCLVRGRYLVVFGI